MVKRKLLGEVFVDKGLITTKTLERALARAKRLHKRLGSLLEEMELITGDELASALAEQYGYRVIGNFARHTYARKLLDLIPVDVAMQSMLFPLKIEDNKLALAMADPTETRIVSNIAANHGLTIIPFVATKNDINAAICRQYLGKDLSIQHEKTVLIVEDDNLLSTMWSQILTKDGYRVKVAADGMEAYKTVISEMPQVVVTEKVIPKLDAYGLFDALRNVPETRHIPIILLTRSTETEEEAKAFEKGFFDFMFKPVNEVTLKTRVKRAFQYLEREYGMIF
ncbi:MAG: response regulator [Deltaproteobacteria bacterium]|nr:response regulator [Deltaproteobacteria bacterium]